MKEKNYILGILLSICLAANAQNTERMVTVSLKAGPIFTSFPSTLGFGTRDERYNEWNLELGVEEKKLGLGLIVRYIAAPGFMPNPIFRPSPYPSFNRATVQVGDLIFRRQKFENFSFLCNKKILLHKNKHRFDGALGVQLREGGVSYFSHFYFFELHTTGKYLDKYGLISRLGYTYLISKHFSVSTNIEYSRFKMKPADFWDFNVLLGVRF